VTRGDPGQGRLHSVLLTAEGFVLFEAEMDDGPGRTIRAVPPFDSPAFAGGFMEDVKSIFLLPPGMPSEAGMTGDGAMVCRWSCRDGTLAELFRDAGQWKLSRWDNGGRLKRTLVFLPPLVKGLPSRVELSVPGPAGYTLRTDLIRAD
jgi:hypothetical protein